MREILLAFGLLAPACSTGSSQLAGAALVPDQAYEESTHTVVADASEAQEPPVVTSAQCVEWQTARELERSIVQRQLAIESAEAERLGWRRLDEYRVASFLRGQPEQLEWRDDFDVAKMKSDRVIDSDGSHWLAVEQSNGCYSFEGRFYTDGADVFQVYTQLQCAQTTRLEGCGSFPGDGCGREPEFAERRFVKAPAKSKLAPPRMISIRTPACYVIEPIEGIDYPP